MTDYQHYLFEYLFRILLYFLTIQNYYLREGEYVIGSPLSYVNLYLLPAMKRNLVLNDLDGSSGTYNFETQTGKQLKRGHPMLNFLPKHLVLRKN